MSGDDHPFHAPAAGHAAGRPTARLRIDLVGPALGLVGPALGAQAGGSGALWVTTTLGGEPSAGLGACQRHDWDAGLVAQRCARLRGAVDRANREGEVDAQSQGLITRLGALLFDELFPPDVKRRLRELDGGYLTLGLAPPLWDLPVELLHDGRGVLALRFALGRLLLTDGLGPGPRPRRRGGRQRILVLADPDGSLPECYNEGVIVRRLLDRADRADVAFHSTRVDRELVREELRDFDAVHVAAHIDPSGLRLLDGPFDAAEVRALSGGLPMPRLVVLNGCASGDGSRLRDGGLSGSFLEAGVEHLVGALYEVPDALARDLAIAFWGELGRAVPIGEALRRARVALAQARGPGTPMWAAYALFGRPEAVYDLGVDEAVSPEAGDDPDRPVLLDRLSPRIDAEIIDALGPPFAGRAEPPARAPQASARLRAPASAALASGALGQPRWLGQALGLTTLALLIGLVVSLVAVVPRLLDEPPRAARGSVVSEPAEVATVTIRPPALALLAEVAPGRADELRLTLGLEQPAFVALLRVVDGRVERLWPAEGGDGWLAGGRHLLPPAAPWQSAAPPGEESVLIVRAATPFDDAEELVVYLNALLAAWPAEAAEHGDVLGVVETVLEREGGAVDVVTY